jgi:hypothetical protein
MILLALVAIALCGAGLVVAGFPDLAVDRTDRALRACIAIALGLGTWSAAYAASRMAGIPPAVKDVALACAGAAMLWLTRRKIASSQSAHDPAPRWLWAILLFSCAVAVAAFLEHDWRFPDGGWDAWMVWNLRARFLVRAQDLRTAFSPNLLSWAHADYPWLVPGLVAQGFSLAGGEPRWVPAIVAAGYGVLAVAVVSLALARLHGARWGLIGGLGIVTLPTFAIFASNQESDIPLAVYVACAAALIAIADARADRATGLLALAGFSAGLGAWTKNEGSLYSLCLAAGLLWRSRDWRSTFTFAAGALPAVALLIAFKAGYAPPNDLARFSTTATIIAHAVDARRWGELLLQSLRRLVFFQVFALWLVAEVLVLAVYVRRLPGTAVGTALFLAAAAYGPIYVLQPQPLAWVFRTSIDRIILQMWPAVVLATSLALARTTAHT